MAKFILFALLTLQTLASSAWAAPGDYDPSYDQGGGYGGATLDERVGRLEKKLSGDSLMEMLNRLEQLQGENLRLRGEVEELSHQLELLKRQQRDMFLDLDRRLQAVVTPAPAQPPAAAPTDPAQSGQEETAPPPEAAAAPSTAITPPAPPPSTTYPSPLPPATKPPALAPVPLAPAATPATTPPAPAVTKPAEPPKPSTPAAQKTPLPPPTAPSADSAARQAAYQKGFNLLKDGNYAESIKEFKSFLAAYPKGEYSDNAAYWLAEAHYVNRDLAAARESFRRVLRDYPQATKLADAQLKLGYIDYDTGQWLNARESLGEVIKRYPDTSAAKLAQKRLDRMKQEGH